MPASADFRPTIVIDSREQTPLAFNRLASVVAGLDTGDYSIRGLETLFGIERKTVPDLVASVTTGRERFERELARLRGHRFKRLLVVGCPGEIAAQHYRGNTSPKSVLHTLAAFEVRYDLPVVFEPTPETAAARIESWAFWFTRECLKTADAIRDGCANVN